MPGYCLDPGLSVHVRGMLTLGLVSLLQSSQHNQALSLGLEVHVQSTFMHFLWAGRQGGRVGGWMCMCVCVPHLCSLNKSGPLLLYLSCSCSMGRSSKHCIRA